MQLTEQQIKGIRDIFVTDTNGAEDALKTISDKRGKFRFFNEDGTVNITLEQLKKKLNKVKKIYKTVDDMNSDPRNQDYAGQIINDIKEIKRKIYLLKHSSSLIRVKTATETILEAIENRKISIIDNELEEVKNKIHNLTILQKQLEEQKAEQEKKVFQDKDN